MLDYGFVRSPGSRYPDFPGRGHRNQGITSRAIVAGVEYSHFFLNPLGEGSHDEGLPIAYAGAAAFGPDTALHNPLAKEYNTDDELPDSPSESSCACFLSFLAFPRALGISGDGARSNPSQTSDGSDQNSYNNDANDKPLNSPPRHKFKSHLKAIDLPVVTGHATPAPASQPASVFLSQQFVAPGCGDDSFPTEDASVVVSSTQLGVDAPGECGQTYPAGRSGWLQEPPAPQTPQPTAWNTAAEAYGVRRCKSQEQEEEEEQRQPQDTFTQEAEARLVHVHDCNMATTPPPPPPLQEHQQQQHKHEEPEPELEEEEEQWLPLVPRNGAPMLPPQTPQLQPQLQNPTPLSNPIASSNPIANRGPSYSPTRRPANSICTSGSICGIVAAAATKPQTHASRLPTRHSSTATTFGNCGRGSSRRSSSVLREPACHVVDTAAAVVRAVAAVCTAGGLKALCRHGSAKHEATKLELESHGTISFDSSHHNTPNTTKGTSRNSRWIITDGPPCSISGLAMTRSIIRQLGLIPPDLFATFN